MFPLLHIIPLTPPRPSFRATGNPSTSAAQRPVIPVPRDPPLPLPLPLPLPPAAATSCALIQRVMRVCFRALR